MNFSSKIQVPATRPKEKLTIKGLMNQKLTKFLSAGAFKSSKGSKFKGPRLKIPKLGR